MHAGIRVVKHRDSALMDPESYAAQQRQLEAHLTWLLFGDPDSLKRLERCEQLTALVGAIRLAASIGKLKTAPRGPLNSARDLYAADSVVEWVVSDAERELITVRWLRYHPLHGVLGRGYKFEVLQ